MTSTTKKWSSLSPEHMGYNQVTLKKWKEGKLWLPMVFIWKGIQFRIQSFTPGFGSVLSWEVVVLYPKNHGISTSHWWGPGDPRPARPRPLAILTHPGPNPSISSQGYGSVMILRLCVLCCRGFCWWFCSAKCSAKFTGFTRPTPRNLS